MVGKETSKLLRLLAPLVALSLSVACVPAVSPTPALEEEPEYSLTPPGADEVGAGVAFPFHVDEGGVLRVLAVQAPGQDVLAFYQKQLAGYGWEPHIDTLPNSGSEQWAVGWAKGRLHFRLAFWQGLDNDPRTIFSITLYRDGG